MHFHGVARDPFRSDHPKVYVEMSYGDAKMLFRILDNEHTMSSSTIRTTRETWTAQEICSHIITIVALCLFFTSDVN